MGIRKITSEDENLISRLYKQLYPNFDGKVDLTEKNFEAKYLPICIEEKGDIVGFATGTIVKFGTQKYGYLEDLIIDESKRGLGLGPQLLGYLLSKFKDEGVEIVFVSIDVTNDKNIEKFYKRFDFQLCDNPWFCKQLGTLSD